MKKKLMKGFISSKKILALVTFLVMAFPSSVLTSSLKDDIKAPQFSTQQDIDNFLKSMAHLSRDRIYFSELPTHGEFIYENRNWYIPVEDFVKLEGCVKIANDPQTNMGKDFTKRVPIKISVINFVGEQIMEAGNKRRYYYEGIPAQEGNGYWWGGHISFRITTFLNEK